MPGTTSAKDLVRQLSRVGMRPDEDLVQRILGYGDAARRALLDLATDTRLLYDNMPASLGPLHALRLLGELPEAAMIRRLFARLPIEVLDDPEDSPANIYAQEMLQIIGRVGAPAVPVLWGITDDPKVDERSREAAASGLAHVATYAPEVRDEVIAEARRRLADETLPPITTLGAAILLVEIGDAPSYKAVMAAYRARKIDQASLPAAMARQYLLGGGRPDLRCTLHPLWERYDDHGPFPLDENV